MKRNSECLGDPNPVSKKQRTTDTFKQPIRLKHRQRGAVALVEHPQDGSIIERELSRAICMALHGAGFNGAKSSALESFQAAVEEYMFRFARKIKTSMQHSRRQTPIPQDFIHALSQFGLSPSILLQEHDLTIPAKATQAPVLPPARDIFPSLFVLPSFPEPTNDNIAARTRGRYIPRHFPSFPSEHAYQATPVFTHRETDGLKVRELAAAEGMQAEVALRKLMAANKAARSKQTRGRRKPPEAEKRGEELWKEAMEAAVAEDARRKSETWGDSGAFGMDGAGDAMNEEIESVATAVNHDRIYWRIGNGRNRLLV